MISILKYLNYEKIVGVECWIVSDMEHIFYGKKFPGKEMIINDELRIWDYSTIGNAYPRKSCERIYE